MPLPLGHAAIGMATHTIISDDRRNMFTWQAALLIVFLSNLPDIDVVFGLIFQNNGSAFHRGPTHSLLFSLVCGFAVYYAVLWIWKKPVLGRTTCVAVIFSHLIADYFFTTSPVSFFWPFEVYWSNGSAKWYQVVHDVIFNTAKDAGIVFVCAFIILANTYLRRLLDAGLLWKRVRE